MKRTLLAFAALLPLAVIAETLFPLKVSENGRYLVDQTGQPFTASLAPVRPVERESGVHAPAAGPLRVLRANPRYFTDDGRRAVYLTGAHTWDNLQDMGEADPPAAFHFSACLPEGDEVKANLSGPAGEFQVEWTHPVEGTRTPAGSASSGAPRTFTAPGSGGAVLHLRSQRHWSNLKAGNL